MMAIPRLCLATLLLAQGAALSAMTEAQVPTVTRAERSEVVAGIAREMNARYVFPDVAAQVERALAAKARNNEYDRLDDPLQFAARLTADLQEVTHDKHIRVRYSIAPLPERAGQGGAPTPTELVEERAREQGRNFGVERVERLPANIGYIDLRGFADLALSAPAITAAMTLVAHTDALIVDLRRNGGGDPATVAFMTSYLFDTRTHLNDLYWREGDRTEQFWTQDWVPGVRFGQQKPVFVLTSAGTFSGAEEFANNLKTQKRATLVGEVTGGGANPGDVQRLSAHFSMFVPSGRAVNPVTHSNWEGTGVAPDVAVPADQALRTAQLMALKGLAATARDPERDKAIAARIAELESAPDARSAPARID
jgi:hypothetical protein